MYQSIVHIRPVVEDDALGLAESNKSLNSPHAPTDLTAVRRVIEASQRSISGQGVPTQVNIVAEQEDLWTRQKKIIGGGALVKMGSDGEFPILWMPNQDGSLTRRRYTEPTLEFGGASVAKDAQGLGVGKAITAARALIAKQYASLFGAQHVLSDFLPPLDNIDTKENAFWEMIVAALRDNGNLERVMQFCEEKTGTRIQNTTELSAVIGNIMSDADRNAMVDMFFPETIPADSISHEVAEIMRNVNAPTEAARANLLKIYGSAFQTIGVFPINGGPNYAAPAELGPTGEGPTPLDVRNHVELRVKMLLFKPLGEDFSGLRNFQATLLYGDTRGPLSVVFSDTAERAGFAPGEEVMRLVL